MNLRRASTHHLVLISLLAAVAACGGRDGATQADTEINSLLPADTVAVARLASLDELERHARDLARSVGESTDEMDADRWLQMLGGMGGKTELIDQSRPIVVALSLPRATPPSPVVMVPATDANAYAASLPQMRAAPVVSGGYVAVPLGAKYEKPAAPSTAMNGLPGGVFAVRADAEKLAAAFGAPIALGLNAVKSQMEREFARQAGGFDSEGMAETYVELARTVLDAAQSIELAIDYRDGRLDAFGKLTVKPGSELDGWSSEPVDLKVLDGRGSGKAAVEAVGVVDWRKLAPRYEGMMAALVDMYPPKAREIVRPLFVGMDQWYQLFGPVFAVEGEVFGADGMSFALLGEAPDAAALRKGTAAMLGKEAFAKLGLTVSQPKATEVDGATIDDYELSFDVEALATTFGGEAPDAGRASMESAMRMMFGESHLPLRVATKGKHCVIAVGKQSDTATLAALDGKGGGMSAATKAALARLADCNPVLVERIDIAGLMSGMARLAGKAGQPAPFYAVPAGTKADMLVSGGIRGNEWRAGFVMDVAGFAKMIKASMPR